MAFKRKNSGIGPGVIVKNISHVPMTRDMKWRLGAACDRFDATEGWIVSEALKLFFKRKGI